MSAGELDGLSALVSGAAAGIGAATAAALAGAGAGVTLVDRDPKVAATAGELGPGCQAMVADVSQRAACEDAVGSAMARFGRLDILVNNAGIQRYGAVDDTPDDVWDDVIATNLSSIFFLSRAAVPHLRRRAAGSIVTIASVQAFASQRRVAAYAASKGGAVALTRSMAVDLAPHIRVNCVCPGSVDTPMLRSAAGLQDGDVEATVGEWGALHPMQRVGTAAEVAQTVLFLAGPRSSFTTGAVHLVDGGLLAVL
jgi:NAD(P)-dependent dehydrogenase (short-subunit alcohol dehydrogenase family)